MTGKLAAKLKVVLGAWKRRMEAALPDGAPPMKKAEKTAREGEEEEEEVEEAEDDGVEEETGYSMIGWESRRQSQKRFV